MADIYTRGAALVKRMARPTSEGGYGQGSIVLVQSAPGAPDPDDPPRQPWDPPLPVVTTETRLDGFVKGIAAQLVGIEVAPGNAYAASDETVTVAPWGGAYVPGDVMKLDGRAVTILKVETKPSIGTPVAVLFNVRR